MQPTVLVHEAFLRMSRESSSSFADETHFKAVAATVMRRVLIDHARRRTAAKRGGGRVVRLERMDVQGEEGGLLPEELLALDDALRRLESESGRRGRVVELRYFGGLTFERIAGMLDVSVNTAKNDWRFARAWLQRALDEEARDA